VLRLPQFSLEEDNLSERLDVNKYMQSHGYHEVADIFKFLGTMGGKVNDEQRQFDVINNIESICEGNKDETVTEYAIDGYNADSYDADREFLKVYKMRFAVETK